MWCDHPKLHSYLHCPFSVHCSICTKQGELLKFTEPDKMHLFEHTAASSTRQNLSYTRYNSWGYDDNVLV